LFYQYVSVVPIAHCAYLHHLSKVLLTHAHPTLLAFVHHLVQQILIASNVKFVNGIRWLDRLAIAWVHMSLLRSTDESLS